MFRISAMELSFRALILGSAAFGLAAADHHWFGGALARALGGLFA